MPMPDGPKRYNAFMASIDILTVSARPEMEEICRWLYVRQTYSGKINHIYHLSTVVGSADDRRRCQTQLLLGSTADLLMLTDDDDYVDPGFLERAVYGMREGMYGEIAMRTYLLTKAAYGEASIPREYPFLTMAIFDRERWRDLLIRAIDKNDSRNILNHGKPWPISKHLIIMRGLMSDPETAITTRKNCYDSRHFPHKDPGHIKLKEWLSGDPDAFARYKAMAEKGKHGSLDSAGR